MIGYYQWNAFAKPTLFFNSRNGWKLNMHYSIMYCTRCVKIVLLTSNYSPGKCTHPLPTSEWNAACATASSTAETTEICSARDFAQSSETKRQSASWTNMLIENKYTSMRTQLNNSSLTHLNVRQLNECSAPPLNTLTISNSGQV